MPVVWAGNTICGDFYGDLVRLGVPGEFCWVGIGSFTGEQDRPHPEFEIFNAGDDILRIALGSPYAEMADMRFAESVAGVSLPPFDVGIFDDNGYLCSHAPHLPGPA